MAKTQIELVEGFDPACPVPACVKAAGLDHRLAVIQHTYRADSVDMYFDEALWRRLVQFAEQFGAKYRVTIVNRDWATRVANREPCAADEMSVEAFLAAWSEQDRDPPEYIMVRGNGGLVMCIATEYWTQIGGPFPYADSYTYSLFSKKFINRLAVQFIGTSESAEGWVIKPLAVTDADAIRSFDEVMSRVPNRPPMPGDEIE